MCFGHTVEALCKSKYWKWMLEVCYPQTVDGKNTQREQTCAFPGHVIMNNKIVWLECHKHSRLLMANMCLLMECYHNTITYVSASYAVFEICQGHRGHCLPFWGLALMSLNHFQLSGYSLPLVGLGALCYFVQWPQCPHFQNTKFKACFHGTCYRSIDFFDIKCLRGYCTPGQFLDCLCTFLKNYNTFITSEICFL